MNGTKEEKGGVRRSGELKASVKWKGRQVLVHLLPFAPFSVSPLVVVEAR